MTSEEKDIFTSKSGNPFAIWNRTAHFMLDDMKELAESKNAPQDTIDRWKVLQKELGLKTGEEISEAQYLMFAKALEQNAASQKGTDKPSFSRCRKCGKENESDAVFCGFCGESISPANSRKSESEVKEGASQQELEEAKADVEKGVASLKAHKQTSIKTQISSSWNVWKLIYWTSAILLATAVFFTLPYWYYQIIRFAICGLAAICAFREYNYGNRVWTAISLAIAVLFNPIVPIHLSRNTWQIFDFITAILMPMMGYRVNKSIANPSLGKQQEKKLTRPFSENKTREEFREWLSIAPLWNRVDPKVIEAIIDKFFGNPMFEVFYHVSREADLIKLYIPLSKLFAPERIQKVYGQTHVETNSIVAEEVRGEIVKILYKTGCSSCASFAKLVKTTHVSEVELKKYYGFAMDTLESAVNLQPTFFPAYAQLAILKHMVNKDDEAIKFCNLGLAKIEELKESPVLRSEALNLGGVIEESETQFRALLKDLARPN